LFDELFAADCIAGRERPHWGRVVALCNLRTSAKSDEIVQVASEIVRSLGGRKDELGVGITRLSA